MKELDTTIFNLKTIKLPVHEGDLLIAQPFLDEAWFSRAVISVIDYDRKDGATGVVLNNSMNYTLADVLEGVSSDAPEVPVFCGGPMSQDRLYFIHTLGSQIFAGAREYSPGLYIGGDFDAAVQYVNEGYPVDGCLRFFIGYSGWSPGQLEKEISEDTWAISPVIGEPSGLLKGEGDSYWHRIVRQLGTAYRSWRFLPRDLHAN
ncbi:MAG: YqgE/AlgH family protein [Bacteroidales bacterium]|nr:YqgE/AlgH family protein [Bacteroidales bacterium]